MEHYNMRKQRNGNIFHLRGVLCKVSSLSSSYTIRGIIIIYVHIAEVSLRGKFATVVSTGRRGPYLEQQWAVGGDFWWVSSWPIGILRFTQDCADLSFLHGGHTYVPGLNHLTYIRSTNRRIINVSHWDSHWMVSITLKTYYAYYG